MGIRGLRSFMEKNGILVDFNLHNTSVVIDGNNICHQLLYEGSNSRNFGGNYSLIKANAKRFFEGLLRCNVKPYVVFDGAHDEDDKKLDQITRKCETQIKVFEENVPSNLECFPVLVYESFIMTLDELGVQHVACDGEADNQIAVLAKQWQCPVISCDNDMYIFDLPGGFIHFTDIKIDMDTRGMLKTKLYKVQKVQEKIALETNILPLAATVLGNVYIEIDYNVVNRFFQRLGANDRFSTISKDLKKAFKFLTNARNLENGQRILFECVDEILPEENAMTMKRKIDTSIRAFKTENEFTVLNIAKYFEGNKTTKPQRYELPEFVLDSIRSGVLSGLPIDVAIGRVILKPTLEVYDQPPVQSLCLPLRQIFYGIVRKSTRKDEKITEIIRKERKMIKEFVKPCYSIEKYGDVPTFSEMEHQNKDEKIRFLVSVFQFDDNLTDITPKSMLLTLALNFFMKHAFKPVSGLHLKSFIFCHILLSAKQNDETVSDLYERFSRPSTGNRPDVLFFSHYYLQSFQECLKMAYTFNALLCTPLEQPDPATVYDGPLMYSFYSFFSKKRTETEVDLYVKDNLPTNHFNKYTILLEKLSKEVYNMYKRKL